MCNAWNHPPGCRCGWGGDGHLGRRGPDDYGYGDNYFKAIPPIYTKYYESFVNPNAKCPVCGAPVFYYQSPHGGRVFFDELGPPWPKHPCTIKSFKTVHLNTPSSYPQANTVDYSWGVDGWEPYLGVSCQRWGNCYLTKGVYKKRWLNLTISIQDLSDLSKSVLKDSLWMIKASTPDSYELSMCYGNKYRDLVGRLSSSLVPATPKKTAQKSSNKKAKNPFLSQKLGAAYTLSGVTISCNRCGRRRVIIVNDLLGMFSPSTPLHVILSTFRKQQCRRCKMRDIKVVFNETEVDDWQPIAYSYKKKKKKK
ncbi:hypothetical protein [uncultured Pseudodesulfovibrio sp.]|uniref:hypothetical protein n=1 Tax=uncultured Pseudodesulfovibrio sp. TaxID=2035858 RepID=UPI0029C76BEB|nr:hypothetical protein [uncultured Pseudodesulfovibrio sp.]